MDLSPKTILLNINNKNPFFKIPAQISFLDNFTFNVDENRIEITHDNDTFYFRHPGRRRRFSVKPKTTKVTLLGVVLQTVYRGCYTNRHTLNLYLEFDQLTVAWDFTTSILAQNYREQ